VRTRWIKTIDLIDPTIVGSVTLQPGEYTIEWSGAGPEVQVSFSRGKKTIVTVPAAVESAVNPYNLSVTSHTEESGVHSLVTIQTASSTLQFAAREVVLPVGTKKQFCVGTSNPVGSESSRQQLGTLTTAKKETS